MDGICSEFVVRGGLGTMSVGDKIRRALLMRHDSLKNLL
jgi:hypothetical protein